MAAHLLTVGICVDLLAVVVLAVRPLWAAARPDVLELAALLAGAFVTWVTRELLELAVEVRERV